ASKAASEAAESAAISEANSIAQSEAAQSAAISEANSIAESKAASEAAESAAISEANSIAESKAASEAAESAAISEANSIAASKAASEVAQSAAASEAKSTAENKAPSKGAQSIAVSGTNPLGKVIAAAKPTTPAPRATSPKAPVAQNQAVTPAAAKQTRRITVIVVDADTGKPLQTDLIAGVPGEPMTFNFHELTQSLVEAGYAVLINPATDLTRFPAADQTVVITVKHVVAAALASGLPSEYQALVPELAGAKTNAAQQNRRTTEQSSQAQITNLFQGERLNRQMVYAPFSMSLQQHHGNGGGAPNPAAGAAMLAAYWESLSGVINFGIQS
ncbi:mucin-binding protein, partial [Lacticaseibacillus camelliae]